MLRLSIVIYTSIWLLIAYQSAYCQMPAVMDTATWLPVCKGRKIGLLMHHASLVYGVPLHHYMQKKELDVRVIFTPEHGLKGTAGAGEFVKNAVDSVTGIPIVSLYGTKKKPEREDFKSVDLLLVDLQDVGARFYTYSSTLFYVLEACGEAGIEVCILDRPNPNGACTDGPVLDTVFKSFVGLFPVPVLHGLTIGELAKMMQGEGWFVPKVLLKVIPMQNYRHDMTYALPVAPSPNLPTDLSVALYPTVCLFEGTVVSMGRGTAYPFEVLLLPDSVIYQPVFEAWESLEGCITIKTIPAARVGAPDPPYKGQACRGVRFTQKPACGVHLEALERTVRFWPGHRPLFNSFFAKLAGTNRLREALESGDAIATIQKQWQADLELFRKKKQRYLLYP
jgi:uncharacterized protein YbbC (DUF1343 family)